MSKVTNRQISESRSEYWSEPLLTIPEFFHKTSLLISYTTLLTANSHVSARRNIPCPFLSASSFPHLFRKSPYTCGHMQQRGFGGRVKTLPFPASEENTIFPDHWPSCLPHPQPLAYPWPWSPSQLSHKVIHPRLLRYMPLEFSLHFTEVDIEMDSPGSRGYP